MPSDSTKNRSDRPEFVFVGEHPAVDFANTVVVSSGHLEDLLGSWSDLVGWLSQTGLSTHPSLDIPASRRKQHCTAPGFFPVSQENRWASRSRRRSDKDKRPIFFKWDVLCARSHSFYRHETTHAFAPTLLRKCRRRRHVSMTATEVHKIERPSAVASSISATGPKRILPFG